jgi:hypothetical protein
MIKERCVRNKPNVLNYHIQVGRATNKKLYSITIPNIECKFFSLVKCSRTNELEVPRWA